MTIINDYLIAPLLVNVQAPINTTRVAEFPLGHLQAGEFKNIAKYPQKKPCLINSLVATCSSY
jgi:hypothetical protein